MDVAAWLRGLGLGEYEAAFRDNRIDAAVLPELTAEDLKEIGVAAVGDRRRLLAAIAALRAAPSGSSPPPTTPPQAGAAAADRSGASDGRTAAAPAGPWRLQEVRLQRLPQPGRREVEEGTHLQRQRAAAQVDQVHGQGRPLEAAQ